MLKFSKWGRDKLYQECISYLYDLYIYVHITKQLGYIAFKTSLLSLNSSLVGSWVWKDAQ